MTINVFFGLDAKEELKHYLRNRLHHLSTVNLIFSNDLEEGERHRYLNSSAIFVGWQMSEEDFEHTQMLSHIFMPSTGVDPFLAKHKNKLIAQNLTLCNNHNHAYNTAQHAVALLYGLCNKITFFHQEMFNGKWREVGEKNPTISLKDKMVGLLGYGAINQHVHQFLSGLDLKFSALKTSWKNTKRPKHLSPFLPHQLEEFLTQTDILILALPLTPSTENLIGEKELNALGSEGMLVNVARGKIINEEALFHSLKEKKIGAAAIDVWYNYKPEVDDKGKSFPYTYPFHQLDNVMLSPHRAGSPHADLSRWDSIIENIQRFAKHKPIQHIVNLNKEY